MALIKCPECGRENVSDCAESCPECGYGIKLHFEKIAKEEQREMLKYRREQKQEERRKIRILKRETRKKELIKKRKKIFVSISILVVILGILSMIVFLNSDWYKYRIACKYNNNADYIKALEIFKEISQYEDSLEKVKEISYNLGIESFNVEDYENAILNLKEAKGYLDADKIIIVATYKRGLELLENQQNEEALEKFSTIIDYSDSPTQIRKANKYWVGVYKG